MFNFAHIYSHHLKFCLCSCANHISICPCPQPLPPTCSKFKVPSSYFCLHLIRHTDTAAKKKKKSALCKHNVKCSQIMSHNARSLVSKKKSHLSVEGLWQIKQRHADLWLVALTLSHNPGTQLSSLGQSPSKTEMDSPHDSPGGSDLGNSPFFNSCLVSVSIQSLTQYTLISGAATPVVC